MKFAVIVPIFNQRRYLRRCLESALAAASKSPAPVEIFCVDDGSTDGSAEIAEDISASSSVPVQVLRMSRSGVSAARNAGLDRALADRQVSHVMFLDSDDVYAEEIFARVALYLSASDVVEFDFDMIDEKDVLSGHCVSKGTNVWGRCFCRGMVEDVRFFVNASVAEDVAFNLEVAFRHHPRLARVREPLYLYRQVGDSETHRELTLDDFVRRIALLEYLISVYSSDKKRLRELADGDLFDLLKQFRRQLRRVRAVEAESARELFRGECRSLRCRGFIRLQQVFMRSPGNVIKLYFGLT